MTRSAQRVGTRFAFALLVGACGDAGSSQPSSGDSTKSAARASGAPVSDAPASGEHRLLTRVDRRVELMSMLFRAAEVVPYAAARSRTPYERVVDARLAKWKGHPAVVASKALNRDQSIGYNAPVGLAAYLEWPGLTPKRPLDPLPPLLDERWAAVDTAAYLPKLRSFAEDAELNDLFDEQAEYFGRVETALASFVAPYRIVPWFEEFFGRTDIEHVLVQGLLTGSANYGTAMQRENGEIEAYQIVVVWKADDEGIPHPDGALLGYVVHEMAHTYVNPVTAENEAVLEASAVALFARVRSKMEAAAYGEWQHMVNESLVRASTRMYLEQVGASEALAAMKSQDDNEGFAWVDALVNVLRSARTKAGRDFRYVDTLPQVAAVLGRFAKDDNAIATVNRFHGSINAVYERKPTVLVPHAADGPTRALEKSVETLHARLGNPVVSTKSQETLTKGQSWVVYGSPKTNIHVEDLLAAMGAVVEPDTLRLGTRKWSGDNLVLIAAHPRPGNDAHAVLLYTAHDDADLLDVNNVFHGPTDWVVAKRTAAGFEVVETGSFAE